MTKKLSKQLEKFVSIPSASSNEGEFAVYIQKYLKPYADNVYIDKVGNVIAHKGKPSLTIVAHIDKIGYMVSEMLPKNIVIVPLKKGKAISEEVWDVVVFGETKVKGKIKKSSNGKLKLIIKKSEQKLIKVGDYVELAPNFVKEGTSVISQGLDNKLGVLVGMEVFKKCKNITFIGSVQEEVDKLGARYAVGKLKPKKVIVLDVTYGSAGDVAKIGKGPAICLKDSIFPSKYMVEKLSTCAIEGGIPCQYEVVESGGSDAEGVIYQNLYTPVVFVGIPIKGMHTNKEKCDLKDLEKTIELLTKYSKVS